MVYKFEVYKDKKGEYRFRFRAPNGQLMFSGQGYKQKTSVNRHSKMTHNRRPKMTHQWVTGLITVVPHGGPPWQQFNG